MVEDTLKLRNGVQIKLSLTDNPSQIHYTIYDEDGDDIYNKVSGFPTSLTDRTDLIKTIKSHLGVNRKDVSKELERTKKRLQKIALQLQGEAEYQAMQEQQQHELEVRKKVHQAKNILKEIKNPLLYIGTIIDWLTAGERLNTLLCFTAGCSQIILKKPISVIGYGESSSGKTHVERIALELLPDDHIVIEKQVSPAALFNRAKTDTYFYDGKIVVYGDMGGQNDHENQQEAFDLMKELQSDGEISKPVSVKDETNNWVTEDLVLKGNPCLWYTTVPSNDIDSQELSRAIVFTPRMDNQMIFNSRGRALSFKKGRTYSSFEEVKTKSELVPYMIEHLRDVMEDYIIINPYFEIITNILSNSKFYKRDTEKYVNLLDTITALNFYMNPHYTFDDGTKAIITTKNDVHLLLSLLEPYRMSISHNIKPKSVEIYKELISDVEGWNNLAEKLKFGADSEWESGFTSRDYFEESKSGLSLRSVQRYFSDLYQAKLLKITDRKNNTNIYDVIETNFKEQIQEIDFDKIIERTAFELGEDIAEIIKNDVQDERLSIAAIHEDIGRVPW